MFNTTVLKSCGTPLLAAGIMVAATTVAADVQVDTLVSPEPDGNFGLSLAATEASLAIGEHVPGMFGAGEERVWVYSRKGENWGSPVKLLPSTTSIGGQMDTSDSFAAAIDLENDVLVAGAPGMNRSGSDSGAIFIFHRDSNAGNWSEVFYGGSSSDWQQQGTDVAVSGHWIVAGNPARSVMVEQSGSVSFFARSGNTWYLKMNIEAPVEVGGFGYFGASVDLEGTMAVIGAPGSGTAWALEEDTKSGTSWHADNLVQLEVSLDTTNSGYGTAVAIEGNLVAVSAPEGTSNAPTGQVFLFRHSLKRGWQYESMLVPPTGSDPPSFGESLAIVNGIVLVGSPDTLGSSVNGTVHTYQQADGDWRYYGSYETDQVVSDLGSSVASDGDFIFAGAPSYMATNSQVPIFDICRDCDESGICDSSQIADDASLDCDEDGLIDGCEIDLWGNETDCDDDGQIDECEFSGGQDCDGDGILDQCAIDEGLVFDCNGNGRPDSCDIADDSGLDCDDSGGIDTCEEAPLEIVFIFDTSDSINGSKYLCELTTGSVRNLNSSGHLTSDLEAHIWGTAEDWCSCSQAPPYTSEQDPGGIASLYGLEVPGGGLIDGDEDWADAAAVVAEHHPWVSGYRLIVILSDECPENGGTGDCDSADQAAIDNAVQVLNGARTKAITILTKTATATQEQVDLATQLAEETGGVFIDDSEGVLLAYELAEVLAQYSPGYTGKGPCGTCLADITCDGDVNGADLAMVLVSWGVTSNPIGDLDANCIVNGADLAVILSNWNHCN